MASKVYTALVSKADTMVPKSWHAPGSLWNHAAGKNLIGFRVDNNFKVNMLF